MKRIHLYAIIFLRNHVDKKDPETLISTKQLKNTVTEHKNRRGINDEKNYLSNRQYSETELI